VDECHSMKLVLKTPQVFKILWSEPKGHLSRPEPFTKNRQGPFTEVGENIDDGVLFFTGVRRFIIIATELGSSTCVWVKLGTWQIYLGLANT
jgi:hypothetical protein